MSLGAAWWRRVVARTRSLRQLLRDTRSALEDVAETLPIGDTMALGAAWWRRVVARTRSLRQLLRDTRSALKDVAETLPIDPETSATIEEISAAASRSPAIVILGTSAAARVRLAHCLLGRKVLPDDPPRGMRWIRLQYGSNTSVQLTVGGSEFELINELKTSAPWDTLDPQDLRRQDPNDLSTTLEIELNNAILKDGLKIIIPPDLDQHAASLNSSQIRDQYNELYSKRHSILNNYNCVYLYAIDRIGKNIFSESVVNRISQTRSEEDFWNSFSLYPMKSETGSDVRERDRGMEQSAVCEASVFASENCLDFNEMKQLNPHSQILFCLFSDCAQLECDRAREKDKQSSATESTESRWSEELPESDREIRNSSARAKSAPKDERRRYEEQIAFMNELLDQWDIMTSQPPKHYVKSQWAILSFDDIMCTPDHKVAHHSTNKSHSKGDTCARGCTTSDRTVRNRGSLVTSTVKFAAECLQTYLLERCTRLSELHVCLVQRLILASFDLARELQVVPKKIQYVATNEQQLFETIKSKFSGQSRQQLVKLMQEVLDKMANDIENMDWTVDDSPCHQDRRFHMNMSNSIFYSTRSSPEFSLPLVKKFNTLDSQSTNLTPSICNHTSSILSNTHPIHHTNPILSHTSPFPNRTSPKINNTSPIHNHTCQINHHTNQIIASPTNDSKSPNSHANKDHHSLYGDTNHACINHTNGEFQDTPSDGEEAVDDSCNVDDYEVINFDEESFSGDWCSRLRPIDTSSTIGAIRVENECETHSVSVSSPIHSQWNALPDDTLDSCNSLMCNSVNVSVKHASLDVQKTVLCKLSRKISLKLVDFIDCLKDSYFGTLQRCLQSLENSCRAELGGRPASEAMRQLLGVGRQVALRPTDAFSLRAMLLDSVRRLLFRLRVMSVGGRWCCPLSAHWRRHTAAHALRALSAQTLANIISRQILSLVSVAHGRYQAALSTLEAALATRLTHSDHVKLTIRRKYAPSFARLCLESTSMCDLLMYGVPELGREIGRGQYGVVYSARGAWAGHARVAVKSVLPHDNRHYHDLAMEFFYTRSIPPHHRIVRLLGSIVQTHSGGPCVLLVSERRVRDLHAAVRQGLPSKKRMRIATDIVEGIRYLHSLGLVHRDIKLKNVLLDQADRAALSDLGFTACEALISGSVVGTPVHMAPELTNRDYHMGVDVYAFGILFWYLCANDVKLPEAFETFQNKEQLWSKVRRGLRPERLPQFSDECWSIMEACWHNDPTQRALLGDIQPRLEALIEQPEHVDNDTREAAGQTTDHNDVRVNVKITQFDDDSLSDSLGIGHID